MSSRSTVAVLSPVERARQLRDTISDQTFLICPACQQPRLAEMFAQCAVCDGKYCGMGDCPCSCACCPPTECTRNIDASADLSTMLCQHGNPDACRGCYLKDTRTISFVKDPKGRYVHANGNIERLRVTSSDQMIGKTDAELFPPELAYMYRSNDDVAMETMKPVETFEEVYDPDGRKNWFLVRKVAVVMPDGKYVIGTAVEATAEIKMALTTGKVTKNFAGARFTKFIMPTTKASMWIGAVLLATALFVGATVTGARLVAVEHTISQRHEANHFLTNPKIHGELDSYYDYDAATTPPNA